jgi:hypothetical protein
MLPAILLYVGAVLFINGVWLTGQGSSEASALKMANREVAVMNVFTGVLGFAIAVFAIFQGTIENVALGSYVLLFAFTYLWVAINQFLPGADGRALGWYCLFVAFTAVPTGVLLLMEADTAWLRWLGASWLAWAVLWGLYFLLLAVKLPIGRPTGVVTALEGIGTAWVPAYLLIQGRLTL